jgi:dTDP-L-rhamnose 4-epimerase
VSELTVCITGGAGCLGSHLTAILQRHGFKVVVLSRLGRFACPELIEDIAEIEYGDIRDELIVDRVLKRSDVLVHYAGLLSIKDSCGDFDAFNSVNIGGAENIINVLKRGRHRVAKVVLASSASVYGEGEYLCQTCGLVQPQSRVPGFRLEDSEQFSPTCPVCLGAIEPVPTHENAQCLGLSAYALTKKAQEDLFWDGCESLGLPVAIFRYSTVYGEGQSLVRPYSQILMQLMNNTAPTIHEDGNQSRDFIYAADAVDATRLWLESSNSSGIFNVGSGTQRSVMNFVSGLSNAIFELSGAHCPAPLIDRQVMPGEIRQLILNCEKIENLGFRAQSKWPEGITRLVNWFHAKYAAPSDKVIVV